MEDGYATDDFSDARSRASTEQSFDAATAAPSGQGAPEDDHCSKDAPSPPVSVAAQAGQNEDATQAGEQHPKDSTDTQMVSGVSLREDGWFRIHEAFPLLYDGVDAEGPCPICLDPLRSNAWRRLSCTHCYHERCLLKWTEAATHLHCPTCRFDLEASALAEFESDFAIFKQELKALQEADGKDPKRIRSVVVTVEHCRKRLFDATLARHFKLRAQVRTPEELRALGVFPDILNVLLEQLLVAHQVLETRCACEMSQLNSDIDAELLALLCEQLFHIHIFLKHICENGGDLRCITLTLCGDMQKHLNHVRRICGLFLQLCRKVI